VKNGEPLEVALPAGAAAMVGRYLDRHRPVLGGGAGADWLFPGRTPGRPKSHDALRAQISGVLAERCGLAMHPHLFRHLAALLILRRDPSAHGQAQRVLGHRQLATTMGFYTGLETTRALEHYRDLVLSRGRPGDGRPDDRAGPRRRRRGTGA
jgi:integrase